MSTVILQLGQLEAAGLVRPLSEDELAYIFKHALTQDAAAQTLLQRTRRDLHRRVAASYARLYPDRLDSLSALLAEHYWQGELWAEAAAFSRRAGDRAMHAYALPEALAQYERALQALARIPASPGELVDATLGWARAALTLAPYDTLLARLAGAETLARSSHDERRLANVLHAITDAHFAHGYSMRAVPALFENYELAKRLGDERLGLVPSFWLAFFMVDRDPRAALTQFDEVLALARKHGNREIEGYALASQALAHARLGQFAQARGESAQALELVQSVSSPMEQADVNNLTGFTYLELGELERALEYVQRGADKAGQARIPACESAGLLGIGFCKLQTGALPQALSAFDRSSRLAEMAGADALRTQALAGLAVTRFFSGSAGALAEMETALANSQAIADEYGEAFLHHRLGDAYARLDPGRAEEHLEAALAFYRRNEMQPYAARALQSAAALYAQQGRAADAAQARAQADAIRAALSASSG